MSENRYEKLSKKTNLTPEEKSFMDNYGQFMTFAQQISSNAGEFCIAYSQAEMAYYASMPKQDNTGAKTNEAVNARADDVRTGGHANLAEMVATAAANGIKLKIVDSPDYKLTAEEKAANVQVNHTIFLLSVYKGIMI